MAGAHSIGPGTLLGRYCLVEKIGSGGMGDVWRASDTTLGRTVAVKILPEEAIATPERRRRFETEARSAATVSHPNLVPVFDYGETDGVLYIVQELVQGQTVAEMLRAVGAIPPERAAEWCAQAAEGLAQAHDAGVLHRDVKPGNLIIGKDGRLRVLDFGLAKMLGGTTRGLADPDPLTHDGFIVGSIHYMSPEQALGRELDGRSDGFSLGIVLYEMLMGKRPFEGRSAIDTMHAIAYEPPRPIDPADPAVPPPLTTILEKALDKNAEDRYQSLREMAVDLRRFGRRASGSSPILTPPTAVEPTLALERRKRSPALVAAMLVLGAVLLAVAARQALLPRGRVAQPPRATRFLVQTESQEESPTFSPDGRAFAYASNLRGTYDVFYRLLAGGAPVRLTDSTEDDREPCFSADGSHVFFVRGELGTAKTSIWSVPALGGTARKVLDGGDEPSIASSGKHLLFRRWRGERTALYVSDTDGGGEREILLAPHGEVTGARLSPDGKSVAFLWLEVLPGHLGDVWLVGSEGGAPKRLTNDRRDVAGHVDWLPDGSEVLFCSVRSGVGNIWMVSPKGGPPRPVTSGSGRTLSPSVSPDGSSLLVETERVVSDAWEYLLTGGAGRALTTIGGVWAPSRLPDDRLLFCDWTRGEEDLDIVIEDAAGARTLLAQGSNPRASADGKRVFFSKAEGSGRRAIAVVDVDGGPARRLTKPEGDDNYPDPTPDGKAFVYCRTLAGKSRVVLQPLGGEPKDLFEGEASASRAGDGAAVFRSCLADGCGVFAVPYAGGRPRLLVGDGRWPALSSDRRTVYALVGPKNGPVLVRVPLSGGTPERLFELNRDRNPVFWAVFTIDVTPGDAAIVATHQKNDHDVVLLEGVFR
jgi:Tol biopolymer transport system component